MFRSPRPRGLTREAAETIAAQGLAFLASEPARLARFLELTGLAPDQIRARADTLEFLVAVLEHIAADDSLLLVFASNVSVAPDSIAPALALLQQGMTRTPASS